MARSSSSPAAPRRHSRTATPRAVWRPWWTATSLAAPSCSTRRMLCRSTRPSSKLRRRSLRCGTWAPSPSHAPARRRSSVTTGPSRSSTPRATVRSSTSRARSLALAPAQRSSRPPRATSSVAASRSCTTTSRPVRSRSTLRPPTSRLSSRRCRASAWSRSPPTASLTPRAAAPGPSRSLTPPATSRPWRRRPTPSRVRARPSR
mmetsp:Transcript_29622/g.60683  ORF Transcript_29622/g.60683 Transcript_29622/m.60683 type:complete len:204 (-) Transcript_29622:1144-1755(-)